MILRTCRHHSVAIFSSVTCGRCIMHPWVLQQQNSRSIQQTSKITTEIIVIFSFTHVQPMYCLLSTFLSSVGFKPPTFANLEQCHSKLL